MLSIYQALSQDERQLAGFYGVDGWANESMSKIFSLDEDVNKLIMQNRPFRPELSLTLKQIQTLMKLNILACVTSVNT